MNDVNELICTRLARAILAVKAADAAGCTVGRVDVGPHVPKIHVVNRHDCLPGRIAKRMTVNGHSFCDMVADIEGCEVHWQEESQRLRRDDDELPPCVGERMRDVAFDIARNGVDA